MKKNNIETFFKEEQHKLVGYARKLSQDNLIYDAEDIVQDVLVNLIDKADMTAPVQNLSSYIYSSLRNRVVDLLRKKRPVSSIDSSKDSDGTQTLKEILADFRYDTVSEIERKELKEELFQAIDSLSEDDRAIVIATEFEQKSFKEISKVWEMPIGTLLSRKSRAMKKLAVTLRNYHYHTGGE